MRQYSWHTVRTCILQRGDEVQNLQFFSVYHGICRPREDSMVKNGSKETLQCLDVRRVLGKAGPGANSTSQTGTRTSDWPHGSKDAIFPGSLPLARGSRRLRAAIKLLHFHARHRSCAVDLPCRAMHTAITGRDCNICDANSHAALQTIPYWVGMALYEAGRDRAVGAASWPSRKDFSGHTM
jgi:hypothetical protein